MKKSLFYVLLLILVGTLGCKKNIEEIKNSKIDIGEIKNHIVSASQAQKIAVIHSIYPDNIKKNSKKTGGAQTSSTPNNSLKQKPEKSVKSTFSFKEGQVDPTAYVINYNEGGFIIVSGDDRMMPILAFSDKGSFNMKSLSDLPPGVSHWFKANHKYIAELRSGKKKKGMTVASAWKNLEEKSEMTKGDFSVLNDFPPCEDEGDVSTLHTTYFSWGPLLITKWGQGAGYNDFMDTGCDADQNYRKLVGCVGVSIAQVMYYHQYPTGFNYSSMWTTSGSSATSALMAAAANAVSTNFGCNGSGASTSDTDNAFKTTFGYSSAVFEDFDINLAVANITSNLPVILAAQDHIFDGGHQWVADGFWYDQTFTCTALVGEEDPPIEYRNPPAPTYGWQPTGGSPYFHMNWGWDGRWEGWYHSYVWAVDDNEYDYDMLQVRSIYP